jgi:hypothetical protein
MRIARSTISNVRLTRSVTPWRAGRSAAHVAQLRHVLLDVRGIALRLEAAARGGDLVEEVGDDGIEHVDRHHFGKESISASDRRKPEAACTARIL